MNRIRIVYSVALSLAFFSTLCILMPAVGQDVSIIKPLPELADRDSGRLVFQDSILLGGKTSTQDAPQLEKPVRPDQQQSPSDQPIQDPAAGLRSLQDLDDQSLEQQLDDPTIASLFEQGEWPRKGIRAIDLDIREQSGRAPENVAERLVSSLTGTWGSFEPVHKVFCWAAPDIRYQPLYFEDVPLERYGQTRGTTLQTVGSGVHFFTSLALLPCHMRIDRPGSCDYPLGFCRPGNDVPLTIQRQFYGHSDR